jgi:hemoglobin
MRSALRRWLFPLAACGLALCLAGPARAVDEPKEAHGDKGAAEEKVFNLLRDLINEGADLYNSGDYAGCYHFWEGALKTMRPFLDQHEGWGKAIDAGMAEARTAPTMWQRAWALRRTMDKIRDDIHPPKKPEATATTEPPGTRPPAATTPPPVTTTPRTVTPPKPAATLWDRLGGEKGVSAVVDQITAVAAKDPKVDFTRGGKVKLDAAALADFHKQMVDLISAHTGGPFKYTGKTMKEAHKGMGITDAQFDALADDIRGVLEKNNVKPADVDAVMGVVESTRKDIVEPKEEKKPEEKKPEEKKPEEKKPADKEDKKPEEKKPEAKKADGTVQGQVTFDGKPLSGGTVSLTAQDGTALSGVIDKDGAFKIEAVQPGQYRITVNAKDKAVNLPKRYTEADQSPLRYEVKEGSQNADLALLSN